MKHPELPQKPLREASPTGLEAVDTGGAAGASRAGLPSTELQLMEIHPFFC